MKQYFLNLQRFNLIYSRVSLLLYIFYIHQSFEVSLTSNRLVRFITRNLLCLLLIFSLSLQDSIYCKTLQKDIVVLYKEYKVGNIVFGDRVQNINGIKKQLYLIDGQQVSWEEYQESLLEAEKNERKKELEKEKEQRNNIIDIQQKIKNKISQVELQDVLSDISHNLNKLSDSRLKPYLGFSEDTIPSRDDLDSIYMDFLPKSKEITVIPSLEVNSEELNNSLNKAYDYLDKVKMVFNSTVNNAIENSDDTKMLKEFLDLIS